MNTHKTPSLCSGNLAHAVLVCCKDTSNNLHSRHIRSEPLYGNRLLKNNSKSRIPEGLSLAILAPSILNKVCVKCFYRKFGFQLFNAAIHRSADKFS